MYILVDGWGGGGVIVQPEIVSCRAVPCVHACVRAV